MHRIAATPGGWNPGAEGVIFLEQTPAPLVLEQQAAAVVEQILSPHRLHCPIQPQPNWN